MAKIIKKIILCSTVLVGLAPALISCSKEPKPEINNPKPGEYKENTDFTNKLQVTKKDNPQFELQSTETISLYNVPISPVIKVWTGEIISKNSLPSEVRIVDQNNNAVFRKVNWQLEQEITVYNDMKIEGTVLHDGKNMQVNAIVLQQRKSLANDSNYVIREDGLKVDQDKSTKDGDANVNRAKANLLKLIDRSGQFGASGSRWDNWKTFGQDQDNNLVFHWDKLTKLSRVEISFWIAANKEGSAGKLPKNIYIWHSNDGVNWTKVRNQDRTSDVDFGPMERNNNSGWSNAALPKNIHFDEVETQWLRITWDPSQNDKGQNYILGITNIFFKGAKSEESLIFNQSKNIYKLKYQDKEIDQPEQDTVLEVNDFSGDIAVSTNGASYDIHLVKEETNLRKYLIVVYNDLGDYSTYNLTLEQKGQ